MIRRPASSLLASALLIAQLLMAPFAHAEPIPAGDADCPGMPQGQTPTSMDTGASDCSHMATDAAGHCPRSAHHCLTHAACSCPCAHTPALGTIRLLTLQPAPPVAADGILAAGTFDPPLFDFLRPPD